MKIWINFSKINKRKEEREKKKKEKKKLWFNKKYI